MVFLILLFFFCSTSLPQDGFDQLLSIIHCPHINQCFAVDKSLRQRGSSSNCSEQILRTPRIEPWTNGYKARMPSIVLRGPHFWSYCLYAWSIFNGSPVYFGLWQQLSRNKKTALEKTSIKKSSEVTGKFLLRLRRQRTNPTNSRSLVNENTSVGHCAFAPFHVLLGSVIN